MAVEAGKECSGHQLQLYTDDCFLTGAVSRFVGNAIRAGESAVLVATTAHWLWVREHLERQGFDVAGLLDEGQVRALDADATLSRILDGGHPSAPAFHAVITPVLREARSAARARRVRVFGEMVDLLWARDAFLDAERLESLWNGPIRREYEALLCAYRVDIADPAVPVDRLGGILASHGSVEIEDTARLRDGFDQAVEEVLGRDHAMMLQVIVASDDLTRTQHAAVELRVLWMRRHMPRLCDRVLALAREYASARKPSPDGGETHD